MASTQTTEKNKEKERCTQSIGREPSLEEKITQETEGNSPITFLVIEPPNESLNSIKTSAQR